MSSTCANCDCSDQTQCVKKGYTADIIDTNNSHMEETMAMNALAAAEHNGKCKCGSNCACTDCTCAH